MDKYDECQKCFDDKDMETVSGGIVNKGTGTSSAQYSEKVDLIVKATDQKN